MDDRFALKIYAHNLDAALPQALNQNWEEDERVQASVRLSHDDRNLFLRFAVQEPQLRRMCQEYNGAVWEDSCVEAFLQVEGEKEYLNFEFSASTKVLVGKGEGRPGRRKWDVSEVEQIPVTFTLLENTKDQSRWNLEVTIDLVSFGLLQSGQPIEDVKLRGNFYCCGDKHKQKHYLSYAPIETLKPDFHTPMFFTPIRFI